MANNNQWEQVMRLCCDTEKTINIESYGDWDFSLKRLPLKSLAEPLQSHVEKDQVGQYNYCYEHEECDCPVNAVQVQQYPQYKNVKEALSDITVEINYTEAEFKQKYGFWEIEDFKVYNRDGNSSTCSFQTKDHAYIGYYGTS